MLESVLSQVESEHATLHDDAATASEVPCLGTRWRECEALSEQVIIYALMSIEAFLNLYGVYRLGEEEYQKELASLGLVPKLRRLLDDCDGIREPETDAVVRALSDVVGARDRLVQPEVGLGRDRLAVAPHGTVEAMKKVFFEFAKLQPRALHLMPEHKVSSANRGPAA